MLIGIRPGDPAYDDNTGAVFHPQDENGTGSVAFYEIQNTTDEILFDIRDEIAGLDHPVLVLNTVFGPTDFTLEDRNSGAAIVDEQSGFDSDVWVVDLSGASKDLRLTEFTDTQAAFYPYVRLTDRQV